MYIAFEYLVWETNVKLWNEEGGRTVDHTFMYIVAIVYEIHTWKSIMILFWKLLICIYYIDYANFCATYEKCTFNPSILLFMTKIWHFWLKDITNLSSHLIHKVIWNPVILLQKF